MALPVLLLSIRVKQFHRSTFSLRAGLFFIVGLSVSSADLLQRFFLRILSAGLIILPLYMR